MHAKLQYIWGPWAVAAMFVALPLLAHPSGIATAQSKTTKTRKTKKKPKRTKKRDSVSRCVSYDQRQGDGALNITLESSCSGDLQCSVSWKLHCDGSAEPHYEAKAFTLLAGTIGRVEASAARCGDDGWSISRVRWSCKAPKGE